MTENVRKTFDMLGVEPNERFKLDDYRYGYIYYIDENLMIRTDKTNTPSICNVLDIITGNVKIIKIPKYEFTYEFTKEENEVLRCFKRIGYNYIARDEDGELALYSDKPYKKTNMWNYHDGEYIELKIKMFESIKWEDSEPFEIPDLEDESEYEIDEKKIEEKLLEIYLKTKQKCDNLTCKECPYDTVNHIECEVNLFIDELIKNNFTFLKESSINNAEFPIEEFQDPEGSTLRK